MPYRLVNCSDRVRVIEDPDGPLSEMEQVYSALRHAAASGPVPSIVSVVFLDGDTVDIPVTVDELALPSPAGAPASLVPAAGQATESDDYKTGDPSTHVSAILSAVSPDAIAFYRAMSILPATLESALLTGKMALHLTELQSSYPKEFRELTEGVQSRNSLSALVTTVRLLPSVSFWRPIGPWKTLPDDRYGLACRAVDARLALLEMHPCLSGALDQLKKTRRALAYVYNNMIDDEYTLEGLRDLADATRLCADLFPERLSDLPLACGLTRGKRDAPASQQEPVPGWLGTPPGGYRHPCHTTTPLHDGYSRRALWHKLATYFWVCTIERILLSHWKTLSRKRKHLVLSDEYGRTDDRKWRQEASRFLEEVVFIPDNADVFQAEAPIDAMAVARDHDQNMRPLWRTFSGTWGEMLDVMLDECAWDSSKAREMASELFGGANAIADGMDGYEYERHCAAILERYHWDTYVTPATGDQGIDVVAERHGLRIGLQCKLYVQPVGIDAVQEVYAGHDMYECDVAVVVSENGFTPAARAAARKLNVVLCESASLADVIDEVLVTNERSKPVRRRRVERHARKRDGRLRTKLSASRSVARQGNRAADDAFGRAVDLVWDESLSLGERGKAVALFREAARGGRRTAFRYLGDIYSVGTLVEENLDMACSCYERGAELGDYLCLAELGVTLARRNLGRPGGTDGRWVVRQYGRRFFDQRNRCRDESLEEEAGFARWMFVMLHLWGQHGVWVEGLRTSDIQQLLAVREELLAYGKSRFEILGARLKKANNSYEKRDLKRYMSSTEGLLLALGRLEDHSAAR